MIIQGDIQDRLNLMLYQSNQFNDGNAIARLNEYVVNEEMKTIEKKEN
jgi:hypothetical protein